MYRTKGYNGYTFAAFRNPFKKSGPVLNSGQWHNEILFIFASKQLLNSCAPVEVKKVLVVLTKNWFPSDKHFQHPTPSDPGSWCSRLLVCLSSTLNHTHDSYFLSHFFDLIHLNARSYGAEMPEASHIITWISTLEEVPRRNQRQKSTLVLKLFEAISVLQPSLQTATDDGQWANP